MDKIRQKLAGGGSIFGTWVALANTNSAEIVANAGYDFVVIDTQHGGIAANDILPLIQIFDGKGVPALVRVTWTDQAQIMRALDLGAAGVVVPMVSTPEQAKLAGEACRYPPKGIRSFGPVRRYYSTDGSPADPICLVMVETAQALDNLEAIASTPNVDGILIGPMDLALSVGFSQAEGLAGPPRILEETSRIVEVCRKHDIISASAAIGLPNGKELVRRGVQMVAASADSLHIMLGTAADLKEMRSWQE
jgi:4-hydroxy-2-oxoheptanedioate aldolase